MIQVFKATCQETLKQQVVAWLETKAFTDESQVLGVQHFTMEHEVGVFLRYEEK